MRQAGGTGTKSMLTLTKDDYDYDEVSQFIYQMREKSLEMAKHGNSIKRLDYMWGKNKSVFETKSLQKRDRARYATNFMDLGIKHREPIQPPTYNSHNEFLNLAETSDEEDQNQAE